eukprot:109475-Pelagomonas_calceolata.AAC.1
MVIYKARNSHANLRVTPFGLSRPSEVDKMNQYLEPEYIVRKGGSCPFSTFSSTCNSVPNQGRQLAAWAC